MVRRKRNVKRRANLPPAADLHETALFLLTGSTNVDAPAPGTKYSARAWLLSRSGASWLADHAEAEPGTRPRLWWLVHRPQSAFLVHESTAAYLHRNHFLTLAEIGKLDRGELEKTMTLDGSLRHFPAGFNGKGIPVAGYN